MSRRFKTAALVSAGALAAVGLFLAVYRPAASLSQTVNAAIDNLMATGDRLLELPLFMLLAGAAVLSAALALPLLRWGSSSGRITLTRTAVAVMAGAVLFALALHADHKISELQDKIVLLQSTLNQERMTPDDPPSTSVAVAVGVANPPATTRATTSRPGAGGGTTTKPIGPVATAGVGGGSPKVVKASPRTSFLIDTAQVQRNLTLRFGGLGFHPIIHDRAADIVEVDLQNLPAIAYMAIVDLRTPGLEIKFGGSLTQKTLTTDFARANNCQVAINGEAGASPRANSGFGVWHGNAVSAGKVLMKEDPTNKRPFLSFDQQNNPTFTPMAAADRTVGPDKYNVIWGRLDALINDRVQTENERDRQPRTAMGISKDGSKLFLLVVDGRQQRYSIGFTRQEVGEFLQYFGAYNGMLCDEGGSSCIYARKYDRILNSPSDGVERPTYTHFGISLASP